MSLIYPSGVRNRTCIALVSVLSGASASSEEATYRGLILRSPAIARDLPDCTRVNWCMAPNGKFQFLPPSPETIRQEIFLHQVAEALVSVFETSSRITAALIAARSENEEISDGTIDRVPQMSLSTAGIRG